MGESHAAGDLAQGARLRAWSGLQQLRDPRAARVWLFRITANLWRDQCRRVGSKRPPPEPLGDEPIARLPLPDELLSHQEELQLALQALDGLPARQREVLYLNACEEMPLVEIAEVLGISPDAAKASLSLARKKLRQRLLADESKVDTVCHE